MKLKDYIKDRIISIIICFISLFFVSIILHIFKMNYRVIIIIDGIALIDILIILLINYFKKKIFYDDLINNLNQIDKKYLVLDTISKPNTYEEKLFNDIMYEINKSMVETIKEKELNIKEFKEFVELWIHEVKIPISSLVLKFHNNKDNISKNLYNDIIKLDNYVDQVLYYVRSENPENDFLIRGFTVSGVVKSVILKNKDILMNNNINIETLNLNKTITSDKKWLEYIINQIINNSIKYKKDNNSIIRISMEEENDVSKLIIYDNGIGIDEKDIKRVFDKFFTGENGRGKTESTGMGLYIVKKLIDKLGHDILIESKKNIFTKVIIIFGKNDMYEPNVTKK